MSNDFGAFSVSAIKNQISFVVTLRSNYHRLQCFRVPCLLWNIFSSVLTVASDLEFVAA